MRGQPGFFDSDDRLRSLIDLGDQLAAFQPVLDFEIFRPELDAALAYSDGHDVQDPRHSGDERSLR
jgi:IS5 family transposase